MTGHQAPSKIVVGVDGSPSSSQALRWAAQQAHLTGAELHAVTSWAPPTTYGWEFAAPDFDWQDNARSTLAGALDETLGETGAAGVHRHVVEGHPARALLDAAAGAELLVVGSRGHGGFSGMLIGSVSQHVIAHAPCPVVVVRHEATGRTSAGRP
ncbi:MAG: UspA domain protein [Modestobacter sp.]|jgi:nucleotide-binding universal stress UspA family protein|nr:UspA domain protein [Modestobacter sp.]